MIQLNRQSCFLRVKWNPYSSLIDREIAVLEEIDELYEILQQAEKEKNER